MGGKESEVGKMAAGLGQNKRRDEMGGASRTREQMGVRVGAEYTSSTRHPGGNVRQGTACMHRREWAWKRSPRAVPWSGRKGETGKGHSEEAAVSRGEIQAERKGSIRRDAKPPAALGPGAVCPTSQSEPWSSVPLENMLIQLPKETKQ